MDKNNFPDLEEMKRHSIKVLGEMIRAYCNREGVTYQQFAEKAGISKRTVIAITTYDPSESPDNIPNPTNDTLVRIGRVCGKVLWWADEWKG